MRLVTSWEVLVLHPSSYLFSRFNLFLRPTPLRLRVLAGFDRRRGVSVTTQTRWGAGKGPRRDELCGGRVGAGEGGTG